MRRLLPLAVAAVAFLPAGRLHAEGLLYKLPADGTRAEFATSIKFSAAGVEMGDGNASLSMASVGTETVGGEKCRWIEFKLVMEQRGREQTTIAKVLIPEKHLKQGADPTSNIKRGWLKNRDTVKEMDSDSTRDHGPLPIFLAGPLKDAKKLKSKSIKTKLGELKCAGVTGTRQVDMGSAKGNATFESWLSDKSPFGVAAANMDVAAVGPGGQELKMTVKFKLRRVSTGAKTELPDNN